MRQKRYDASDIDRLTKIDKALYFGILTACAGSIICLATLSDCTYKASTGVYQSHFTKTEFAFKEFFERHNSPKPVEMAIAVSKTRNPSLMAALAIVESNGDPSAIGDSGVSKGAFQVQERYWGPVSVNASEQAIQAERILEDLVQNSRGRLRCGLAKYNGGKRPPTVSFRYASRVLKKAKEIEHGIL